MNIKLISMFHKALKEDNASVNFNRVNQAAMKCGYLIHPDCCTKDVEKWIGEQSFNPNATFYKTWQDITSKNRWELALDQVVHYLTTYGTDFAMGNGYVPNENPIEIPYKDFKVIMPATKEEIFEDCMGMLRSGIALKDDTISVLVEYITEYGFIDKVNLDEVKNKEAQAILSMKLGILPRDPFGMFRCIVYRYTGSALLIKSKESISTIKGDTWRYSRKGTFDFSKLSDEQLKALSTLFLRYKPLFLAMKDGKKNNKAINKIRKYAKVYHKPLKKGFWEICLTSECQIESAKSLAQAQAKASELNNFRKIQLMQGIKERLLGKDDKGKMFVIRNGKMFIREDYSAPCDAKYLVDLYNILETSLVDSIKGKATNVKLPKGVELSCPTSEKNFIGNFPFGSYVPMSGDHNVFGIYWRNEWGARDLDLWYTDKNGNRYGWSSSYYDAGNTIVFSGDMTNAQPEATELFYLGKKCTEGNVGVNVFSGSNKCKLKLFVASEDCEEALKQHKRRGWNDPNPAYMCDPNNIVAEAEIEFSDGGLKKIGCVHNNKLVLMDMTAGSGRVSTSTAADIIHKQMTNKVESYVDLKPILEKAGFKFVEDLTTLPMEEPYLDFSNPAKDDLIKLFS